MSQEEQIKDIIEEYSFEYAELQELEVKLTKFYPSKIMFGYRQDMHEINIKMDLIRDFISCLKELSK